MLYQYNPSGLYLEFMEADPEDSFTKKHPTEVILGDVTGLGLLGAIRVVAAKHLNDKMIDQQLNLSNSTPGDAPDG